MGPFDASQGGGQQRVIRAMLDALASQRSGLALTAKMAAEPAMASLAQQQFWMLEKLAPGSPINNLCVAYRLRGSLSVERLRRAMELAVERHEVLRAGFELSRDGLLQRPAPAAPLDLPVETLPRGGRTEDRMHAWAQEQADRVFDVGKGPLLRPALLRLGSEDHLLTLTVHHLAFDGWSFDVLMRDLCAFHDGEGSAHQGGDSRDTPGYSDYAAWQLRRLKSEDALRARDYWTARLARAPAPVRLPGDAAGTEAMTRPRARHAFAVPAGLVDAVATLARRVGVSEMMVHLAVYMVLLQRYTGQQDLVVAVPVANRCLGPTMSLVGPFAQLFPIRVEAAAADRFCDVLANVCDAMVGAYTHQAYPVSALLEGSPGGYPGGRVQCTFAFQNVPGSAWRLGDLQAEAWDVGNSAIANDITLTLWRSDSVLSAHLEFDRDRYRGETIAQFAARYLFLLEAAVRQPERAVGTLPLESADAGAHQSLLSLGDGGPGPASDGLVHEIFRQQAQMTPDAVALVSGDRRVTYAELDAQAERVAARLSSWLARRRHSAGIQPTVAFLLEPSIERIVFILATLKAGAAYLPLNRDAPGQYLQQILADAGTACLIVDDALAAQAAREWASDMPTLLIADLLATLGDGTSHDNVGACQQAQCGGDGDRMAYVMYTSGSTGRPKGVRIAHRGIIRLAWRPAYIGPLQDETLLQLAPLSFDASTFEIWAALLNGATLALPSQDRLTLDEIADAIARYRVGTLWLGSGLFETIVDSKPEALVALRQLLVGGDVVSPMHAQRFLALGSAARLFNCYGPTENTTFSTVWEVLQEDVGVARALPIGTPIPGAVVRVLDGEGQPVPVGVVGEACVGGAGLMLGYQRGEAAMIADPLSDAGQLLYRTGDAVRMSSDGVFEFCGRLDGQIKLRGFRVELAEIERELARSPSVTACAVAPMERAGRVIGLVAAVVLCSTGLDVDSLHADLSVFLARRLPPYMVPSLFVSVAALPLTSNGKVDRRAVSMLGSGDAAPRRAVDPPRSRVETSVHVAFARGLGRGDFGVNDDFFGVGGDSLGALSVLADLQREFDGRPSLAELFELRTVSALAERLSEGGDDDEVAHPGLVRIRHGRQRTLFMLPGGKGGAIEMTLYADLLRHVDCDLRVWGLLARTASASAIGMEQRARSYVGRLRELQPNGPYLLAGECVGGIAAFEVARQLRNEGEAVSLLLIDSWFPTRWSSLYYRAWERPLLESRAKLMRAGTLASHLGRSLADALASARLRGRRHLLRALPTIARGSLRDLAAMTSDLLTREVLPADADLDYARDAMSYRPQPLEQETVFLASEGNLQLDIVKPWQRILGGRLRLLVVPGTHETYLRELAPGTAAAIQAVIESWPFERAHNQATRHTDIREHLPCQT